MLKVNETLTGVLQGIGTSKYRVVLESPKRDTLEAASAREQARNRALQDGFDGGFCETPQVMPVDAAGEVIDGMAAMGGGTQVAAFRGEYTFASRL